jgi:NADH dehydrogenase (ubiquinone) flavoprotein 2
VTGETAAAESFALTPDNLEQARRVIARYPEGRQASAVLPVLDLVQRQNGGWLSPAAVAYVADMLDMALIRVYEVISFYEMLNAEPVGEHMVRVCTTTPCMLRGSSDILSACRDELGVAVGETSDDGKFTLVEFECLGACVNAPIVWIDDDYYEDLDPDRIRTILRAFRAGERPEPGSQIGRQTSAPIGGRKTLLEGVAPPPAAAAVQQTEADAEADAEAQDEADAETLAADPPADEAGDQTEHRDESGDAGEKA